MRAARISSRRAGRVRRVLEAAFVLLIPFSVALARAAEKPNLPPAAKRTVDFQKEIKPIFEAHCMRCHGPDKQKSEFRLDRKEAALKGGENHAPDIRPGKSAESPLIQFVSGAVPDMKMPQKGEPLSAEQIGLLRAWIDQGAPWPADEKVEVHWSLKPVSRPEAPKANTRKQRERNSIDAFVLAKLSEKKLGPSGE